MSDVDATTEISSAALLSASTVYGIAPLELRARVVADGVVAGVHKSRRFGSSSEFAEHKIYAPGDDVRRLDWKAYARVDRYFVRRYQDETHLDVAIVLDTSGSMAYAGGARGTVSIGKLEAARTLAAAIAWIAAHTGDAAGVTLFAGDHSSAEHLPPRGRSSQLAAIIDVLERARPDGGTDVGAVLERVGQRLARRSLVVVISDLIDTPVTSLATLGVMRKRGSDVIVLQTLDRDELELPFDGVVRFEDLEGDREIQVDVPLVREAYLEEMKRFLDEAAAECGRLDVRWHLAPTDASPVATLTHALDGHRIAGGAR
jgi:uncharacterized protein (DUF58 family)